MNIFLDSLNVIFAGLYHGMQISGAVMVGIGLLTLALSFLPEKSAKESATGGDSKTGRSGSNGLKIFAKSVVGDRAYQQDFFVFSKCEENDVFQSAGQLAVVCDGMGGMEGGELASRTCAETIYKGFYEMGGADDICQLLKELIGEANREVSKMTSPTGRVLNSGTTVVATVVKNGRIYWASAGDSRIYLFREDNLKQLTRDHNFRLTLMERCAAGLISINEVEANRQKDALISYVGKGSDIIIDTGVADFDGSKGDIAVLCSDGLYKYLSNEEIRMIIQHHGRSGGLAETLVNSALTSSKRGKRDNITVLTIMGG